MVNTYDSQNLRELARMLPDIPRWVETRSMLLSGDCEVYGLNEHADPSFIVTDSELMSVVGMPGIEIIKAVVFMIDHMYKLGKHPVWGAEESNAASMNLAARLGFVVVDQIKVFKRPV